MVVVTADQELRRRCHGAAARGPGGPELRLVNPDRFLEELERCAMEGWEGVRGGVARDGVGGCEEEEEQESPPPPQGTGIAGEIEALLEEEIRLWTAAVRAELELRRRPGSAKKRRRLSRELAGLKGRLAGLGGGRSTIDRITSVDPASAGMDRETQDRLLGGWESRRGSGGRSPRREGTGDRMLLAEIFRRRLEKMEEEEEVGASLPDDDGSRGVRSTPSAGTAGAAAEASGQLECKGPAEAPPPPLRIVAISDTHGLEDHLTAEGAPAPWYLTDGNGGGDGSGGDGGGEVRPAQLPTGDVLIHLGDYSVDGPRKGKEEARARFDRWLAEQPHPTKIVLRGNHDPYLAEFPSSRAVYVKKPTTLAVGGWNLSLVPYMRHGNHPLPGGDVLATHVPPRAILDRCLSGELAGSSYLRAAASRQKGGPPLLWLCGHIHEGRGAKGVRLGGAGERETVVINTSNANPGLASSIAHGPVVLDLAGEGLASSIPRSTVQPESSWDAGYPYGNPEIPEGVGKLLVAIDLGLRMGVSVYTDEGKLLRYEQMKFGDADELRAHAPILLESLEDFADSIEEGEKAWSITHVAIEGGDVALLDVWRSSIKPDPAKADLRGGRGATLITVRPEEWRANMLTVKEKKSGRDAKAAARLIARQVVDDFGVMEKHQGKFKTDSAEAVTLGYYLARRMGWISRGTVVRRSTNGSIIVPR